MADKDEVVNRLQRVNYRLQSCLTERARLESEIVSLQKKRDFLLSLVGGEEAATQQPAALPALAASAGGGQVEVSTAGFVPQSVAPGVRIQQRRISLDDLLGRAQVGIVQLQGATQEMAKATESIITALDVIKNVLGLLSPEGRRQLSQIAQGLFGALSGVAAPREARLSVASTDGQAPQQADAVAMKAPDILGALAYITSPAFLELLASFIQPRQPATADGSSAQ